jgi:flavorubredoxin
MSESTRQRPSNQELRTRKDLLLTADRLISFSHFESDECGALNEWLEVAPNAEVVCNGSSCGGNGEKALRELDEAIREVFGAE